MSICDRIRSLLFRHPLFETVSPDQKKPWEILIVGFTGVSEAFFKQAMQLAVIHPYGASVRILCTEAQKKEFDAAIQRYPAFRMFFSLNGEEANIRNPYGIITLQSSARLQGLLSNALREQKANYIFISARNDNSALALAKQCIELSPETVVVTDLRAEPDKNLIANPLFVPFCSQGASDPNEKIGTELERMARNLHWIWANPTDSYADVDKQYQNPKNHNSSLDSAASVQYKLYCAFGIDLKNMSFCEAAAQFQTELAREEQKYVQTPLDYIGWAEHRRWCVEQVFEGYQVWDDFEQAAQLGTTHYEEDGQKRHLCLRESLPDTEIHARGLKILQDVPKEEWHTLSADDFPDPIDQVSIRCHAAYQNVLKNARGINKHRLNNEYLDIERSVHKSPEGLNAFYNWKLCIQRILQESDPYAILLYDETLQELEQYIGENDIAVGAVKRIHSNLIKAKKAFEYKDFRSTDTEFSVNIPHILTYSDALSIVVPVSPSSCEITNASSMFRNLAAIHALEPAEGHLLICVRNAREWADVHQFLMRAEELFMRKKRHFRTEITAHIFSSRNLAFRKDKELRTIKITRHYAESFQDSVNAAAGLLKRWRRGTYAVQYRHDCALSGALAGRAAEFPHFIFDTAAMKFSALPTDDIPDAARMFDFYRTDAITPLLIQDVSAISGAKINTTEQPGLIPNFADVAEWFVNNTAEWKLGCAILAKFKNQHYEFKMDLGSEPDQVFRTEILQSHRFNLAQLDAVFQTLQNHKIIRNYRYYVTEYGNNAFEMSIRNEDSKIVGWIFNFINFDNGNGLYTVYTYEKKQAVCVDIDLLSNVISLEPEGKFVQSLSDPERKFVTEQKFMKFLETMKNFNLIWLEKTKDGKDKIFYKSRQIKSLLTVEGRLFEVYLYYQIKKKIPNLLSSVEILWDVDHDLKNELDVVGILGYETVIVEAKACNDLDVQTVYKISSIAKRFGINPQTFLVHFSDSANKRLIKNSEVFHVNMISGKNLESIIGEINQELDNC